MRALIVGYGSIARRHIDNLRALGGIEAIGVLRPDGQPKDAPGDLRFVRSVGEALARPPDFAVIASPSALHAESLLPLLKARVPCYIEKPPVTTAEDVAHLRSLENVPVTLVGCNLRFLPSLVRMRELLRGGVIGTPVRASLQAGQWLPDWRSGGDYRSSYSARPDLGGGVIFDLIHEIDAARWLFGEFDTVHACSARSSRLEIESEDSAAILLARPGGPLVTIGLDYVARPPIRRYEIFGDEGTLTWDLQARELRRGDELLDANAAGFDMAATYRTAMAAFVAGVRRGSAVSPDLPDGLVSTELALRAKACQ